MDILPDIIKQEIALVKEFLKTKGINKDVVYSHHTYDVTKQCDVSVLYNTKEEHGTGDVFVKTTNGVITEYYQKNYSYRGRTVFGASLDANTDQVIDIYHLLDENHNISKVPGNVMRPGEPVTVYNARYDDLPNDIKEQLKDFPFKERIYTYARNNDGRVIIEYTRYFIRQPM